MTNTQHKADEFLNTVRLPALSPAVMRLIDLCNDPEIELTTIARIVAQDVALTGKVLSLANSAFLGARLPFHDIEQAVVFLGSDTIRNLAVSTAVHEAFGNNQTSRQFSLKEFWFHSLLCGLLAKEIAEEAGYESPSRAYLTGLLHDLGKCLLATTLPHQYDTVALQHGEEEVIAEKRIFGISHPDAGLLLLTKWQVSPGIVNTIRYHHSRPEEEFAEDGLSTILAVANFLAGGTPYFQFDLIQAINELEIKESRIEQLVTAQQETIIHVAKSLGVEITQPESKDQQQQQSDQDRQALTEKLKSHAQLLGALDNLLTASTTQRAYLAVEESLQLLFGLERCLIMLPDATTDTIRIHGSVRNSLTRKLRHHIVIPGECPDISACMETLTSRFVPADTIDATSSFHEIVTTVATPHLFLQPFPISNTIKGVLVLGCETSSPPADETFAETLHLLGRQLGQRILLDQQQRQHAEELAAERQQTQTEIARSLAHEIASPLGTIQNYLTVLQTNPATASVRLELATIAEELSRIKKISFQLHDLSESARLQGCSAVNLNTILKELVQLFSKSREQFSGVQLTLNLDENLPPIRTDTDAIKQILHNLLNNSLEAVCDQGSVQVSSKLLAAPQNGREQEIMLSVTDNGPGVPESLQTHFFQAGVSSKGTGHTGLGLAIVKKLANELGGRISYQRTNGETVFALHLPLRSR